MLVDADNGAVVYCGHERADFATSLIDGPHANTNVGRLFRQVLGEHKKGLVRMTDFENYVAVESRSVHVHRDARLQQLQAHRRAGRQLSVDEISRTMNGDKSWAQDGLGKTGIAFVAGPGMLLRSEHRGIIEEQGCFSRSN